MDTSSATTSQRWGNEARRIPLDSSASCMCKHPSLDIIAVSGKGFIVLLDPQGEQLGKIKEGSTNIRQVTFDSTGKWVFASVEPERGPGKTEGHTKKWELSWILEGREGEGNQWGEISRLLKNNGAIKNNGATHLRDIANWSDTEITHILPTFQSDIEMALNTAAVSRSLLLGHCQEGRFGSFGSQKFSNDGDSIILFVSRNKIRIVPLSSDRNSDRTRPIHTFSHPLIGDGEWQNNEAIMWIGQSPDSRLYATVSWDSTAILWSAETGEKLQTLKGPTGQNWVGAFARNGEWFAVGGGDGTVYVFSTSSGELLRSLGGFQRWVRTMAVSKDGDRLIAGCSGSVQEYNTASWNLFKRINIKNLLKWSSEITNLQYATLPSGEAVVLKMSDERIFVFVSEPAIDNNVALQGDQEGYNCALEIDPVGGAASKGMGYTGTGDVLLLERETGTKTEIWSADRDECIRCWKLE